MAGLTSRLAQGHPESVERLFVAGTSGHGPRYQKKTTPRLLRLQDRVRWGAGGKTNARGEGHTSMGSYHSSAHSESNKRSVRMEGGFDFTPSGYREYQYSKKLLDEHAYGARKKAPGRSKKGQFSV